MVKHFYERRGRQAGNDDQVVIDRHHAGRKEDRTQAFGDTRDQDRIDCQGQFPGKRLWRKPARNSLPALRHGMEILIKVMKDSFLGRIRSEEHTSELQSLMRISYAVFCTKNKHTITR